jgi:hypothetical protein
MDLRRRSKTGVADEEVSWLWLFIVRLLVFFIAILFVIRMLDDQADINIGLKHLDDVKAFNKVFPNHYEKITGMGLFWGNESWVSMTVAYDRYIVRMVFDVEIGFFSFGKKSIEERFSSISIG